MPRYEHFAAAERLLALHQQGKMLPDRIPLHQRCGTIIDTDNINDIV